MPNTNFLKNAVANSILGGVSYVAAGYFVALSTTTPTAAGTGATEPTIGVGGYARASVLPANMTAAVGGVKSNSVDIVFPTATADWASNAAITHFVVYDAATAGNMLAYVPVPGTAQGIVAGSTFRIPVGSLVLTIV